MNVCVIYDCEYPWDIRVEKICKSIIHGRGNVSLVCRNKKADALVDQSEGIQIFRLMHTGDNILTRLINVTLFFNPFWLVKIFNIVKKKNCGIIIVRDLPLALSGIIVGKILKKPVVIDMAEPYPLTVRQRRQFEPFKPYHLITRNIFFADLIEKIVIKTADHIFVVCREAKDRLVATGGGETSISIVHNTPEVEKYHHRAPTYPGSMATIKDTFIVLYVGILIGGRGIDIALKAFYEISKIRDDIKLVIVGNGKLENEMHDMAGVMNLQDTVFFEGWIDNHIVPDYINSCDLGLLPFMSSQHINHTLANKLFDFMATGKPVLCSDVIPMQRIINETGAGYLFEAENHLSLRDRIIDAVDDEYLVEKGRAGKQFVESKYNWDIDKKNMLDMLNSLA